MRLVHILLIGGVAFNALLGGFRGGVAICFGGGHEHAIEEVVVDCDSGCAHEGNWALPVHDDHDHGCTCDDVEFEVVELLRVQRADAPPMPAPDVEAPIWGPPVRVSVAPRGPPRFDAGDPGVVYRLSVVRATRFNI